MANYRTHERAPGAMGYRIAGLVEAVAAVPLGALWLLSGIGVGFCSDGHDGTYCDSLSAVWMAFGVSVAACLGSGAAMIVVAGRPADALKTIAAVAYGASAVAALGLGFWLITY